MRQLKLLHFALNMSHGHEYCVAVLQQLFQPKALLLLLASHSQGVCEDECSTALSCIVCNRPAAVSVLCHAAVLVFAHRQGLCEDEGNTSQGITDKASLLGIVELLICSSSSGSAQPLRPPPPQTRQQHASISSNTSKPVI
jgi:hypothetical protein